MEERINIIQPVVNSSYTQNPKCETQMLTKFVGVHANIHFTQ